MKLRHHAVWRVAACLMAAGTGLAEPFAIESFDGTGRLVYGTLDDGTNYNYRVEWAPSPAGPWSEFGSAAAFWLNAKPQDGGRVVTNTVPMCYRVVANRGDYLSIDLSGGTNAASYPVTYYRTLSDVPGGANSDGYKTTNLLMRLIPKGSFTMGSPTDELARESQETQHRVTLTKDFYLGVFEVTQRQWELVMGNRPSYFRNTTYYATRPVGKVSYNDIRENPNNSEVSPNWPASDQVHPDSFMGRMRAKTGLTGFDLPTEAQWEYACRAGTATALNSGYNLTNTTSDAHVAEVGRYWFNNAAFYNQDCDPSSGTASAGSYLANAWGLYDMHGNVSEWCLDQHKFYTGGETDPKGGTSSGYRIYRGMDWSTHANECRSARRGPGNPRDRYSQNGFRACWPAPGQP